MTKNSSSGLRSQLNRLTGTLLNDQSVLIIRMIIVITNYWLIFHWRQVDGSINRFSLFISLFILIYGLLVWLGPKFFNYRWVNLIVSFPEIIFVSLGFYLFPYELISGGVLLYFVGVTVNVIYGGYLSNIFLALLVNICYPTAVFHHLKPEQFQDLYLLLINFNLVTLLISFVGWKLEKMLRTIQLEKEESKKQLFRLQALSRISKEITSELELDRLFNLIVQKTGDLIKSTVGGIIILENDNCYRIKAAKGIPKNLIGKEVSPNTGLLGHSLKERKTSSLKINTTIMENASPLDEQYNFLIISPIISKGELMGHIFLLSASQTNPLTKDDRLILETMSEYAAIGMVNANLFKITATLSVNDYLTGVGNLRYFYQQLEHCLAVSERYQQPCSLMMIDSDCFRKIKNTYGNAQGFMHIKYLAEIIKTSIRSSDLVARYDRDTFMVILPQTAPDEAIILGERIKNQVLNNPTNIDGQSIPTTVSIGIASYPIQAKNIKSLVNAVESALHQAAKLGGNQLVVTATPDV